MTPATTGMSEAEICIHSRIAASKVGATTMDRPEWVAANPVKTEVYCALTNNKNRGVKPNAGGDATPAGGPNPRIKISMVKLSDGVLITKIILPTDLLGIYSSLPAIQICILMPMPDQTT